MREVSRARRERSWESVRKEVRNGLMVGIGICFAGLFCVLLINPCLVILNLPVLCFSFGLCLGIYFLAKKMDEEKMLISELLQTGALLGCLILTALITTIIRYRR